MSVGQLEFAIVKFAIFNSGTDEKASVENAISKTQFRKVKPDMRVFEKLTLSNMVSRIRNCSGSSVCLETNSSGLYNIFFK